jgi:hypothetical protein
MTANVARDTYRHGGLTTGMVTYEVLRSEVGLPPVYIVPADDQSEAELLLCEVGSGEDFARCSRAELREWAEAILYTLGTS